MYEACLVVPCDTDVALEIPAVAKLFLMTLLGNSATMRGKVFVTSNSSRAQACKIHVKRRWQLFLFLLKKSDLVTGRPRASTGGSSVKTLAAELRWLCFHVWDILLCLTRRPSRLPIVASLQTLPAVRAD